MLRRTHPAYVPPFELVDFMVMVQRKRGRGFSAEATVKVRWSKIDAHGCRR